MKGDDSYGIYLYNTENNTIYDNVIRGLDSEIRGIYLNSNSNLTVIYSNTINITGNNGTGIELNNTNSYNDIYLNNITMDGESSHAVDINSSGTENNIYFNNLSALGPYSYGVVLFDHIDNSSVYSNVINSSGNGGRGIYLGDGTLDIDIYSNNITTYGQSDYGILLYDVGYDHQIFNNNVTTFGYSSDGMHIDITDYTDVHDNIIRTHGSESEGISLLNVDHSIIHNNNITTSNSQAHGILMAMNVMNNTISSNNITAFGSGATQGMRMVINVRNNNIHSNKISSRDVGIILNQEVLSNMFQNNTITAKNIGIHLIANTEPTYHNLFVNTNITNHSAVNIRSELEDTAPAGNNTILNGSFNRSMIEVTTAGENNFTVAWYVKVNVSNITDDAVNAANVNISDIYDTSEVFETTNTYGILEWRPVVDAVLKPSQEVTYNNHKVEVDKSGYYTNITYHNINKSMILDIILTPTDTVEYVTLGPVSANTSTRLNCTFNVTSGMANIPVEVSWYRNGAYIESETVSSYTPSTNYTVYGDPYKIHVNDVVKCNVTGVSSQPVNYAGSNEVTIQNYTTTLNLTNETGRVEDEQILFMANYSSQKIGDISDLIFMTVQDNDTHPSDPYSIVSVDFDGDGVRDDFAVGTFYSAESYSEVFTYNGSVLGSAIVPNWDTESTGDRFSDQIEAVDYKGDGKYDGIIRTSSFYESYQVYDNDGNIIVDDVDIGNTDFVVKGRNETDELFFVGASGIIMAVFSDGTLAWSNTTDVNDTLVFEIHPFDYDGDGYRDEVIIYHTYECYRTVIEIFDSKGREVWEYGYGNNCRGDVFGLGVGDVDTDGDDEFVFQNNDGRVHASGDIKFMVFNRTLDNIYNISVANWMDNTYEIVFADLDEDGREDDFLASDKTDIKAFNNSNQSFWNSSYVGRIHNLHVNDINDDGLGEILAFGSTESEFFILNRTSGSIIKSHDTYGVSLGDSQASRGVSLAIETGDFNNDGIYDMVTGDDESYVYVFQDADCVIRFDDGMQANMTWNYTTGFWEYNRSFSTAGSYNYNVTCEKGGYQTKFDSEPIGINVNTPPAVNSLSVQPAPAYTGTDLGCQFTATDLEASTLDVFVMWTRNGVSILNQTVIGYSSGTSYTTNLSSNYTFNGDMIGCRINVTDGVNEVESGLATRQILNYTAEVNMFNETGKVDGETILFTANYSSFIQDNIGRIVWNTSDLGDDVYSVTFYKCYDGKTCFAAGTSSGALQDIVFFNYTKELMNGYAAGNVRDLKSYDFDGDGNENIIAGKESFGGIGVYYPNGTEWWSSPSGPAPTGGTNRISYIAFGDVDGDSNVDIMGGGYAENRNLTVYNYTGTHLWTHNRGSDAGVYRGVAYGYFNNSGTIIFGRQNEGYGLLNISGDSVWNTSDSTGDVNKMNIDNDEYDELLIGIEVTIVDDNGTIINKTPEVQFASSETTYEIEVADIDNDGVDEFIYGDENYVLAYSMEGSNYIQEWNFTNTTWNAPTPEGNRPIYFAMSIFAGDVNDDIYKEVVFGGNNNTTFILTHEGESIYHIPVHGRVGRAVSAYSSPGGRHSAIDLEDFNLDGVNEILVGSGDNRVYILQDVNCEIRFDDGVQANMTWNTTSGLWEYSRVFNLIQSYGYNVTCEKGGYETVVNQSDIQIMTSLNVSLTKVFDPSPIVARTQEVVNVTVISDIVETFYNVTAFNVSDEVPSGFGSPLGIQVYFHDWNGGAFPIDITNDCDIIFQNNRLNISVNDLGSILNGGEGETGDYINITYQTLSSEMEPNEIITTETNVTFTDVLSKTARDDILKNITASINVLRGFKDIWVPDPANPQKVSIKIVVYAMGGPLGEIELSDMLPAGSTISENVTTYFNNTDDTTTELIGGVYLDGYKRKEITITNQGTTQLTNFPAYIKVAYDSDMQSDYDDLRFYDGECGEYTQILDYEIENYTTGGEQDEAYVWVRIPQLSIGSHKICMYYDNPLSTSGENSEDVWNSEFAGVWHLSEMSGNLFDSTSNSNDGIRSGLTNGPMFNTTGAVDGAQLFTEDNEDHINISDSSSLDISDYITVEAWIKNESFTHSWKTILSKIQGSTPTKDLYMYIHRDGTAAVLGLALDGPHDDDWDTNIEMTDDQWHHIAFVYNGTHISAFKDGVLGDLTAATGSLNLPSNSNNLSIGRYQVIGTEDFNGTIDEIRISSTNRSKDWIKQTYEMIANQAIVVSIGAEEDYTSNIDFIMEPPVSVFLPDGSFVDVYYYNFSVGCANWPCKLYDKDNLTIYYNVTLLGGGRWELPAIISAFDPSYQKHIQTEMYTSANIPSFDVEVKTLTTAIAQGDVVRAKLKMTNVGGELAKVDVHATYTIKTMEGTLITEKSETFAVVASKEKEIFIRPPGDLEPGMYIFEAFVTYTGREAVSTDTFEVKSPGDTTGDTETVSDSLSELFTYVFLLIGVVIVAIFMVVIVLFKRTGTRTVARPTDY